ncbi:hypothetical protein HNY73_006331 [Argiope bruennichi]|uniref:Uncharacterized protein n=1 Tax=Argiope bruennichi TaxID=94029 RepID=A0A8T0FM69_ARGBR|nr:hypothetical protein HNY73_006331 [Argiope bruennichi]
MLIFCIRFGLILKTGWGSAASKGSGHRTAAGLAASLPGVRRMGLMRVDHRRGGAIAQLAARRGGRSGGLVTRTVGIARRLPAGGVRVQYSEWGSSAGDGVCNCSAVESRPGPRACTFPGRSTPPASPSGSMEVALGRYWGKCSRRGSAIVCGGEAPAGNLGRVGTFMALTASLQGHPVQGAGPGGRAGGARTWAERLGRGRGRPERGLKFPAPCRMGRVPRRRGST